MPSLLKNRLALSTVVTTLIILVVSVLLAGVVTYFAINVTSTRVQEENLHITKQHVWHNSTDGKSLATLMIINTGGRDIVIDKISVRGQECGWNTSATKYVIYFKTQDAITQDLAYAHNINRTGSNTISIDSIDREFDVASGDVVIRSGFTMILYVAGPDSISINDVGLTVSIEVFTAQAMYYREANVQAVS